MNPQVSYTHLTVSEIMEQVAKRGYKLSRYWAKKLLKKLGLSQRSMAKNGTYKSVKDRDAQFRAIKTEVSAARQRGAIIVSVDGKKKEQLGSFYRKGKLLCTSALRCLDHDFPSYGDGKVCPYGIYDVRRNEGFVFLNASKDTADYAADCLHDYLKYYAPSRHPGAKELLILCDGGGSNGSANKRYKELLQWLSDKFGLRIRVMHYPPYCSKYNPCDHRLFPHVTRAFNGVMLDSMKTMKRLIKTRAKTKTGLKTLVRISRKTYETGVKSTRGWWENHRIEFDQKRPKWNYTFTPQTNR